MQSLVITSPHPHIRVMRINRPEKMNATDDEMYEEMTRALTRFAHDPEVDCVVITGTGNKAFWAGSDVSKGRIRGSYDDPVGVFMTCVISFPKLLCAAVNGRRCVGIGFSILPHCDFVYSVPHAMFSSPIMELSVAPGFAQTDTFPRILGAHAANRVLILGETLEATELKTLGLIGEIFPKENFMDSVLERLFGIFTSPGNEENRRKAIVEVKTGLLRPRREVSRLLELHRRETLVQDSRTEEIVIAMKAKRESKASKRDDDDGNVFRSKL